MALTSGRGHEALRRARISSPAADYFLTLCTEGRQRGLADGNLSADVLKQAHALEDEAVWQVRTMVIMPDHLHLLVTLGDGIELSDAIRLFKGRLTPALRQAGLRWQRAYYDHRLRPKKDCLPVFLYIFLNPYRAGLVQPDRTWPGYFCAADDWNWFRELTDTSCPFPDWLR